MELPNEVFAKDKKFNEIAKDLFHMDLENKEFHFVMLSVVLSLMLKKGLVTEEEIEAETDELTTAFKLMKNRNNLLKEADSGV